VIYFANPSTPKIRALMSAGTLGCIVTPRQRLTVPDGALWCADNGAFGKGYPGDEAWWNWLKSWPAERRDCLFVAAPDVVGNHEETLAKSRPWLERIRELGFNAAFVAQDGMEWSTWDPWEEIDCLFLGGSDTFKLGPDAADIAAVAASMGKWVHMGRVNSQKRFLYASSIGCSSADGTYLKFGPDVNLPNVMKWLAAEKQLRGATP
jgi:hypothetical protein